MDAFQVVIVNHPNGFGMRLDASLSISAPVTEHGTPHAYSIARSHSALRLNHESERTDGRTSAQFSNGVHADPSVTLG